MTDSKLGIGVRVRLADDVQDAGRCGYVVGNEVFVEQWWCPILWDDADDPDFSKSSCLEPEGGMEPEGCLGDESSQLAKKISSYLTRKTGSSLDGETVDHIAKLIRKMVGSTKSRQA